MVLGRTQVTDAGLKNLAGLKALQGLDLSYTNVTDEGLKTLGELEGLQWLNLEGTKGNGGWNRRAREGLADAQD